jgi:hypothetical protein
VPKHLREEVIRKAGARPEIIKPFLDIAGEAADWSTGFASLLGRIPSSLAEVAPAPGSLAEVARALNLMSEGEDSRDSLSG